MIFRFGQSIVLIIALLVLTGGAPAKVRGWEHPVVVQDLFVSIVLFPFEQKPGDDKDLDVRRQIVSNLETTHLFNYRFYCPEGAQLMDLIVKGFTRTKAGLLLPAADFWKEKGIHYLVYGRYSVTDGQGELSIEVVLYEVKTAELKPPRTYREPNNAVTQDLAARIARALEEELVKSKPKK